MDQICARGRRIHARKGKIEINLISNWQVNLHNEIMMRNCCQR